MAKSCLRNIANVQVSPMQSFTLQLWPIGLVGSGTLKQSLMNSGAMVVQGGLYQAGLVHMLVSGAPMQLAVLVILVMLTFKEDAPADLLELFAGCRSITKAAVRRGLCARSMDIARTIRHDFLTSAGFARGPE